MQYETFENLFSFEQTWRKQNGKYGKRGAEVQQSVCLMNTYYMLNDYNQDFNQTFVKFSFIHRHSTPDDISPISMATLQDTPRQS